MTKELAIILAFLAILTGLCAVSFYAGADHQKAVFARETAKQAQRQNKADAQASADARSLSTDIDKGLTSDARKTDTAVTGAKSRLHALKPPVAIPAPQCGPSAYIIKVEGATPDDVWRAYATGRNSVFAEALSREASDLHTANSAEVVPSTAP